MCVCVDNVADHSIATNVWDQPLDKRTQPYALTRVSVQKPISAICVACAGAMALCVGVIGAPWPCRVVVEDATQAWASTVACIEL